MKTLIKDRPKEMQSAKIIMTLSVRRKKSVKLVIPLDPEDVDGAQDIGGNTVYIRVDMPSKSLMTEFYEGSNMKEQLQCMFAYIKTQVENPWMCESGFSHMHVHINFQKSGLTRGSPCINIKLLEWIEKKRAV